MSKYNIQIDDLVREATEEEAQAIDEQRAQADKEEKARLAAQAAQAKLKSDALAKLGLTADEVAALLS